ncbi:hypothetical protein AGLY_007261 [Aphis glycines]|uniref:Uncharacterized protein n=1 Tax=Aphis glycines TaxID=307491 RepID=A0A6G0TP87_APHGL|nr:hypothetical protein AGLY_007261 [Aphis glycines]
MFHSYPVQFQSTHMNRYPLFHQSKLVDRNTFIKFNWKLAVAYPIHPYVHPTSYLIQCSKTCCNLVSKTATSRMYHNTNLTNIFNSHFLCCPFIINFINYLYFCVMNLHSTFYHFLHNVLCLQPMHINLLLETNPFPFQVLLLNHLHSLECDRTYFELIVPKQYKHTNSKPITRVYIWKSNRFMDNTRQCSHISNLFNTRSYNHFVSIKTQFNYDYNIGILSILPTLLSCKSASASNEMGVSITALILHKYLKTRAKNALHH